ncbi:MAG: HAMP domain-containing sensor histidine kinase [Cyclobacteriaceae bacterium]
MVFKDFRLAIVIRGILLIGASILGTLFYLETNWWALGLCGVVIIIVLINTVYFYNTINRKLTFFFESIRNEDSTLHFPEHVRSGSLKNLHHSLNNINEVLSTIRTRSEHKEWFYKELMRHSSTGLMAVDSKGYIEIINKTALQLFNVKLLVHIDRLKQLNKELADTIDQLEPNQSKTVRTVIDDELHMILVRMVELKFQEEEYFIYSLYDIRAELEENELDSWQKLIRIMTHEIMNSITPISSISDTLSGYFKKGSGISESQLTNISDGLEVIHERSKGLTHFVDNYRRLSRLPKPEFHEIVIESWIERLLKLAEQKISMAGVKMEVINQAKTQAFLGDQKLLTQVALNLIYNSIDALDANKPKARILKIKVIERESNLCFQFIDNGPGIPLENIDQIFIPFFTTKEEGSGIGLSLSRQIMRLHKGGLNVRSNPGQETVFEMVV